MSPNYEPGIVEQPTLYPAATARLVPYSTGGGIASLGLILHVQQGDGSPFGYFSNPANGAVSHWWISKTGHIEQYVDAARKSWAQVAGNATYHSVETEGYVQEPLTDAQILALADLYRWGVERFGWPLALANTPGEHGFGVHSMGGAAWGGHPCPGDIRNGQRADVLARITEAGVAGQFIYRIPEGEPGGGSEFFELVSGKLTHIGPETSKGLVDAGVKVVPVSAADIQAAQS